MKFKYLPEPHPKLEITAAFLQHMLRYDDKTGALWWRHDGWGERPHKANTRAERIGSNGYLRVTVRGRHIAAHRVAWAVVTGRFPVGQIDHVNGCKSDNRMSNMRDVDATTNSENKRVAYSNNKSGLLGASFDKKTGRYMARVYVDGKRHYVGQFDTPEEAHLAYVAAKRELHHGCTL